MRRHLLIFRHAEAAQPQHRESDFDRPLTLHGQRQVGQVMAWLQGQSLTADRLFASAAHRTKTTAQALAPALRLEESQVYYDEGLYLAPSQVWLDLLSQLPDTLTAVALVGHNPGLNLLCQDLTGRPDLYLDPAAAVLLEIELTKWEDVLFTEGLCQAHFSPE